MTALTNENIKTFDHIFKLVLQVAPHLATAVFVLVVDGDKAVWNSAREHFKGVIIILCLYHAGENIKKHFGCLCKIGVLNGSLTEKNKIKWIQCQENDCGQWRKLLNENIIPTKYSCSSIEFVTCGTPQDPSCE